ncbi:hypothetical protein [Rhizobium sp. EC-SD404]|uniref:hypothetical protein n=1 Tax=Rhizobium sp. EC-SD404 TaxID=2038389 RepID=UPI0012523105|nr:hypothetical protein [Rhizobium sp. EC-SD404]VVT00487.1 hypothetical protein RHIZ404_190347 [Rhizobium sp. EC-SD404]
MRMQIRDAALMSENTGTAMSAFLRVDPHPDGSCRYQAGFIDADGNICGEVVPLSQECVESAVFAHQEFTVMTDTRGDVSPCPMKASEGVLELMFAEGRLAMRPVDEMIREALELAFNEPPEELLQDLALLRRRLQDSLAHVDDAITDCLSRSGTEQSGRH